MRPQSKLPAEILRHLACQENVVTRQQALAAGMGPSVLERLCRDGHWTPLARGIYLGHNHTPSWASLAWAGVLQGGADAALGGRAAAFASGLSSEVPNSTLILVPHGSQVRRGPADWVFKRTRIPFSAVGSPPRCSIERTVIDLCASEPDRVAHWVTTAIGARLTVPSRVLGELAHHERMPSRRLLQTILQDAADGAHSPLEALYLNDVERAHGLPVGRRQQRLNGSYTDVDYELGLLVELDGRLGHEGLGAFRDMRRDNRNMLLGRPTLRFGWLQCASAPCEVAAQVAQALTNLGWLGELRACRRCRA